RFETHDDPSERRGPFEAFTTDGRHFAICYRDTDEVHHLRFVDVHTGKTIDLPGARASAILPQGLVVVRLDRSWAWWSLSTMDWFGELIDPAEAAIASPDGRAVV